MPLVRAHPHAEATYHVIPSEDGSFAAEVRIPDTQPTKVGPFETSADAEAWIHDGGGGWIRPVVCVDGWIIGGWRMEQTASQIEITVMPFDRISSRADPAINREVSSIGSFLQRPARWSRGPLVGFNTSPT